MIAYVRFKFSPRVALKVCIQLSYYMLHVAAIALT